MLAPPPPNPGSSPRVHVRSSKRLWSSAATFCLGTAVPGSWLTKATGVWDAPFQSPKMGQKWKENGLASKNSHEKHLELGESTSINSATQLSLVSTCPLVRIELHLLINFLVSAILSCPESCLEVNPAEGFKIPSRSQSNHSIQCPYHLIFFWQSKRIYFFGFASIHVTTDWAVPWRLPGSGRRTWYPAPWYAQSEQHLSIEKPLGGNPAWALNAVVLEVSSVSKDVHVIYIYIYKCPYVYIYNTYIELYSYSVRDRLWIIYTSRLPKPTKKKVLLLPEDQVFAEKARLYVEGGKQGFGRRVFWIFMVVCVFVIGFRRFFYEL